MSHDFCLGLMFLGGCKVALRKPLSVLQVQATMIQKDFVVVFPNTTFTLNQCYILVSLLNMCAVCEDIAAAYVRWWGGKNISQPVRPQPAF